MAGRNAGARGTDDTDMAAFINAARKCNKTKIRKDSEVFIWGSKILYQGSKAFIFVQ